MEVVPLALLILTLVAVGAVNVFAVHFGAEDPRPLVRIASVGSGLLAMLCVLVAPGAFLRFLLTADTMSLTYSLLAGAAAFTAISLILDIAIACRLRRNAA